ncbi:MAG TPA: YafY family protein [Acidimicrobiales bacterium]|nr:YafY family protein [Acidimicrobiales bacterium]
MRADRLVAALLILQARGRVTATALAEELEISERTARRDLEALAMAGIPVYSQPGRGGGWSLVGGARTDLSGLTAAEVRTLFLVAGPAAATPEVKAALRKLVRALPETFRAEAEAAASAVVLDPTGWDHHRAEPPAHLGELQKAVIDGVQVRLSYTARSGTETERIVHPLGLVAKRSVWYLIAKTEAGLRTFRVGRVRGVVATGRPVERPEGFDLEEAWRSTLHTLDEHRVPSAATLRVDPEIVPHLRAVLGTPMTVGKTVVDGRVDVEVRSYSAEMIAGQLAGFGARVEVLAPKEVRDRLSRIATELAAVYG